MGIEVGGLLGLIWLIIVVWAIVKVAKSSASGLAKLLWIIALLVFPLVVDCLVPVRPQGIAILTMKAYMKAY